MGEAGEEPGRYQRYEEDVIPANDDAIRAVKLLTAKMADAVLEGRQGMQTEEAVAEEAPVTEEAE